MSSRRLLQRKAWLAFTKVISYNLFAVNSLIILCSGIGAAMMREASYTSLRIGLYEPMKGLTGADQPGAGIMSKFLAGALAGGIGSCFGNPFDVLKTRMMANEGADRSVGSFAKEVYESNGIGGFYKGI